MNKGKIIPILLFLLLLLIILCTWCHSNKIAKNRVLSSTEMMTSLPNVKNSTPISFYLSKNKNKFELKGNFSNPNEKEKIHAALGIHDLKDTSVINTHLIPKEQVIILMESLIPLFYNTYDTGSIVYENNELIIDGIVETQSDKDAIGTLLANSTILSKNNTLVIKSGPSAEELAKQQALAKTKAKKIAEEEAKQKALAEAKAKEMAEKKAEQKALAEAKAKEMAEEKAKQKVTIIEKEIQEIINFENITFELGKATLTEKSIDTVSHIAIVLNKNPNIHVEIGGHTDNSGDDILNLNLSQRRVDTVKEKLIEMEVSANRLKAVGYGESQPLVSNDTKENRRINRRVEFKILGE